MTLDELLSMADAALGGRKGVMRALKVSRQRLYSAAHGGPPLRAERLAQLGFITGVDITAALRAGGQTRLADLLEKAARTQFADTSPAQRALLRSCSALPERTQGAVMHLVAELALTCEERSDAA